MTILSTRLSIYCNLNLFEIVMIPDFSTYKKFVYKYMYKMLTNFGIFWQSRDLQCLDKLADRRTDLGQSKYRHCVSGQQEGSGTGEGGHLPWGQQIRPGKRFVYTFHLPHHHPKHTHLLLIKQSYLFSKTCLQESPGYRNVKFFITNIPNIYIRNC